MFKQHLAAILFAGIFALSAFGATSEFTYQGQLRESNLPGNGSYDFSFALFDAPNGGNQIGAANSKSAQTVTNGVFTVLLDFGNGAFDGSDRYLEISVRKANTGTLTPLSPRQKVTSAPSAVAFTGALAGDVVGGQLGTAVVTVGGLLAAQVASGADAANNAASAAVPGRIVIRDGNGNFQSAAPLAPDDVPTKQYVDDASIPLSISLNNEIARAQAAEATLTTNLNNEIARAQAAEAALTTNLNNEIAARTAAVATLTTNLNNEIAARAAADTTLTTNLNNEITARQAGDTTLTTNLNNEIARATAAEGTKVAKAGDTMTGFLTLNANPTANLHAATKQYVDAADATLTTNLSNETGRATAAEATLTTNLNNEITRATAAEGTLTANLNNEIAARQAADTTLTTNLNNEAARATAAEGTLTTNLNNEIARATAAEGTKVAKAGDTMTGFLTLNANPTANLHAATKQYVDTAAASAAGGPAGGDLTGNYPNPTIAAGAVTDAKVANGISYSKLSGAPTSLPPSGAAGGDLTGTFPNPTIAAAAVTDAKVANGISYSKLSGAPTSLPPSGAAGGDLTGTFPNPVVAANAVTSAKILDGTVTNADISAAASISYSKLNLTGSLQGSDIAAGTFTSTNSHRALGNNDNTAREMRMLEPSGSGVNYSAFKAQAQAGDITYTLPNTAPTAANQVLQVQAVAGNNATLSWAAVGGGAIIFGRTVVVATAGNTAYNVVPSDDIVGVDMSAGTNFTVNLPAGAVQGEILIIKIEKYNNALLPVLTIDPSGGGQIDGNANLAFGNATGIRRLYSDGAGNWYTW